MPPRPPKRTPLQRHPVASVAVCYAISVFYTCALVTPWPGLWPRAIPVTALPFVVGAVIACLLYHLRDTMPPSRVERVGRIVGGAVFFVALWFVAIWLCLMSLRPKSD